MWFDFDFEYSKLKGHYLPPCPACLFGEIWYLQLEALAIGLSQIFPPWHQYKSLIYVFFILEPASWLIFGKTSEACICWNKNCTCQWISHKPTMTSPSFNILTTLPISNESLSSIRVIENIFHVDWMEIELPNQIRILSILGKNVLKVLVNKIVSGMLKVKEL